MISWFYQVSTFGLLLILNGIIIILAVIGLYLFNLTELSRLSCEEFTANLSIIATLISVFLGIIFSFIIVGVWQTYELAKSNSEKEAEKIYLLHETIAVLPNTEITQNIIKKYLDYIINEEYPALNNGTVPPQGKIYINTLRNYIYNYEPTFGTKETFLYDNIIDIFDDVVTLRIDRITIATQGIPPELWWSIIINVIILFVLMMFLKCQGIYHYIFMVLSGIYVATSIFLIVSLTYPFSGDLSVSSDPFSIALYNITNPPELNL
jgi:hypothetical protein